jgi:UDP-glucuronate 4-epimerase
MARARREATRFGLVNMVVWCWSIEMSDKLPADITGKRILVTGAAGFIGFHSCGRLLAGGAEVLGVDDLNAYYDVQLKRARLARLEGRAGFAFERCDVADKARVLALLEAFRPHYVVHLAAQAGVRFSLQDPSAYVRANVDGFLAVLEACRARPVHHLIYASSSSVYGANGKVPFCETDRVDNPRSLYAVTKRANELMAHTYAELFGIPASGLRFFTVYGPWGRPDMAYFSFTKAILEGRPIDVFNHGQMQRDFTYIDDVVEAIARLLPLAPNTAPAVGAGGGDGAAAAVVHRLYNVGNHSPVALQHFIAVIEAALGRKADLRLLPMQPGDVPITYADVARLAAAVDFAPRTPLAEGMAHFVAWYRQFYNI